MSDEPGQLRQNQLGGTFQNGKPLPKKTRLEICQMANRGVRASEISRTLLVSHGCVSKILNRFQETASIEPGVVNGNLAHVPDEVRQLIEEYREQDPNISAADVIVKLKENFARRQVSFSTLPTATTVRRILESDPEFDEEARALADGALPRRKKRRTRTNFEDWMKEIMEAEFQRGQYPDAMTREQVAQQIGYPEHRVQVWFSNRRARYRKQNGLPPNPEDRVPPRETTAGESSSEAPTPAQPQQEPLTFGAAHNLADPMRFGGMLANVPTFGYDDYASYLPQPPPPAGNMLPMADYLNQLHQRGDRSHETDHSQNRHPRDYPPRDVEHGLQQPAMDVKRELTSSGGSGRSSNDSSSPTIPLQFGAQHFTSFPFWGGNRHLGHQNQSVPAPMTNFFPPNSSEPTNPFDYAYQPPHLPLPQQAVHPQQALHPQRMPQLPHQSAQMPGMQQSLSPPQLPQPQNVQQPNYASYYTATGNDASYAAPFTQYPPYNNFYQ